MAKRPECGVATVWAIGWITVCLLIGGIGLTVAAAASAQHRVDGAADLASLSAAAGLQRGVDPCAAASLVARANHVALKRCTVRGADVLVVVTIRLRLPFGIERWALAEARAGPT